MSKFFLNVNFHNFIGGLDIKAFYDRGIVIEGKNGNKLLLDPELTSTPIKYPTFVTHAHSDHTAAIPGASKTYMTKITQQLYDISSKRKAQNYKIVNYNEPFEVGDFEIEFLQAGHLYGAAQIVVRNGKDTVLYTGDFCPEDLLTVKGAEVIKNEVDLAIMDSTYGNRNIMFEPRANSRQSLFSWIISQLNNDCIPVINVGHLGGAQEVIKFINQLTSSKLPILVSSKIASVCEIYEKAGIKLEYYKLEDKSNHELVHDKCLILVPRNLKTIEKITNNFPILDEKVVRCIITGQSAKYGFYSFDYSSSLSTHANFGELMDVIEILEPNHIFTHFGYHKQFADVLRSEYNLSASSFSNSKPIDITGLKRSTGIRKEIKDKMKKEEKGWGFVPLDYFVED